MGQYMNKYFHNVKWAIRLPDGAESGQLPLKIAQEWDGNVCKSKLINSGEEAIRIKEVALFNGAMDLASDTKLYGEGLSMLSQTEGTIEDHKNIGSYTDVKQYKLPQKEGLCTVYNLAILTPEEDVSILMAFSSCRRFCGEFRFGKGAFEAVLDMECVAIEPGAQWELEEFIMMEGKNLELLLDNLAHRIVINHPKLPYSEVPTGWCSWYCYGPDINIGDIFENMEAISKRIPSLKYIQIDDGYQPYMGDWLEPNPEFSGDMKELCLEIKKRGFEPAIWVAPFIAEKSSNLFREHKDWFVMDEDGTPLPSDRVSFGGWRRGPWYMLDGTNPGAQEYLKTVFRTMREEWNCKYFKLDANMWGALLGGRRYDKNATRVEAYRRGMKAIRDGAGQDSFILGCNAPMWPSLGTVHGMRLGDDIVRSWDKISSAARQMFLRNWQHNRLWINDPDAVVLENSKVKLVQPDGEIKIDTSTNVTEDEFIFHATAIYATGGMALSGDKIFEMSEKSIDILSKLLPPVNKSAIFDDTDFNVGRIQLKDRLMLCLFNWNDQSLSLKTEIPNCSGIIDFWTGEELEPATDNIMTFELKPHSAKLLVCMQKTTASNKNQCKVIESDYKGHKRLDFNLDGREAILICPSNPVSENKWIWRAEFFGAFDQADMAMVEKGWYLAYYHLSDMYGSPEAIELMRNFQKYMQEKYDLYKKTVLFGFSRGGLYAFNYTAKYPEKVGVVYLDAPVLDIKSWPGGYGKAERYSKEWEECLEAYNLNEETVSNFTDIPLNKVSILTEANIPILVVAGGADTVVPFEENSKILVERYKEAGGYIKFILKPDVGHHPHSLEDPTPITDFILEQVY